MVKRTFNYGGFSAIEINAPTNVLERIADTMEEEQENISNPDCVIKINQSKFPVEIQKDKQFKYLTIKKDRTLKHPSLKYYRYNTHIRTIKQKSFNSYEVDSNTLVDEESGLLCVRNHLSNNPKLVNYPLLHASLININDKGILITGSSKHGKTTLMIYLLQEKGGVFISDDNVVLDTYGERFRGLYVPKKVRVRFPTIASSKLSRALQDLSLTNATQYLDSDFIKETIDSRNFEGEWGLTFSRKSFCRLLGVNSGEDSQIDTIIFPNYQESKKVNIRSVGLEEGIQKISGLGLIKKSDFNPKGLEEKTIDLNVLSNKELKFLEVSFSRMENLLNRGFEI